MIVKMLFQINHFKISFFILYKEIITSTFILTGAYFLRQQWIWACQMLTLKRCFSKASDTKKVYGIMMIANPLTTGSKFCQFWVTACMEEEWKFEEKWMINKILE